MARVTLEQALAILDRTGNAFAQSLVKVIRRNADRVVIHPSRRAMHLRLVALAALEGEQVPVEALRGTNACFFTPTREIHVNGEDAPERVALFLLHEACHAVGQGELRAWVRTCRIAEGAYLHPFLTDLERECIADSEARILDGDENAHGLWGYIGNLGPQYRSRQALWHSKATYVPWS